MKRVELYNFQTNQLIYSFYTSTNPNIQQAILDDIGEACKYMKTEDPHDWEDHGEGWIMFKSNDVYYILHY
jgi:hypothetical protein